MLATDASCGHEYHLMPICYVSSQLDNCRQAGPQQEGAVLTIYAYMVGLKLSFMFDVLCSKATVLLLMQVTAACIQGPVPSLDLATYADCISEGLFGVLLIGCCSVNANWMDTPCICRC